MEMENAKWRKGNEERRMGNGEGGTGNEKWQEPWKWVRKNGKLVHWEQGTEKENGIRETETGDWKM